MQFGLHMPIDSSYVFVIAFKAANMNSGRDYEIKDGPHSCADLMQNEYK